MLHKQSQLQASLRREEKDKNVIGRLRVGPYREKLRSRAWKCCIFKTSVTVFPIRTFQPVNKMYLFSRTLCSFHWFLELCYYIALLLTPIFSTFSNSTQLPTGKPKYNVNFPVRCIPVHLSYELHPFGQNEEVVGDFFSQMLWYKWIRERHCTIENSTHVAFSQSRLCFLPEARSENNRTNRKMFNFRSDN